MNYYLVDTPVSSRTAWQIKDWTLNQIESKGEIIKNSDGTFSVLMPVDFKPVGPEILNKFRNYQIPKNDTYIGEGILYKSAKITDVISGSNINFSIKADGWIMNERTQNILKSLKIGEYGTYKFPILKNETWHDEYSFLAFNANASPYVDFKNSIFALKEGYFQNGKITPVEIDTKDEFHKVWKELQENVEMNLRLIFMEIKFHPNFDLDLFSFHKLPFSGIYASEKLIEKIEKEKITGLDYLPQLMTR